MRMVGNALDVIAEFLAHFGRKVERIGFFEQISDTALAGLGVDTDNVGFVNASHIGRVDGQIRHVPDLEPLNAANTKAPLYGWRS